MFWKYFIEGFFSCFCIKKRHKTIKNTYVENHFVNISEYFTKSFEKVVGKYERN